MENSISIPLSFIGHQATLTSDVLEKGTWILRVDGAEQSHLNPSNPTEIRYEYLQRIESLIRSEFETESFARFLHLGAGALTLLRSLQIHFPNSEHYVVEIEPDLLPAILGKLPVPDSARCVLASADAASAVQQLRHGEISGFRSNYECIIVDIFHGEETAPELQVESFYDDLAALMSRQGLLLVNVGDEADLKFTRRLLRTIQKYFPVVGATAHPSTLNGQSSGNIILFCSLEPWNKNFFRKIQQRGPFPAKLLDPVQALEFASDTSAK